MNFPEGMIGEIYWLPLASVLISNSIRDLRKKEIFLWPTALLGLLGIGWKIFLIYTEVWNTGMTLREMEYLLFVPLLPGIAAAILSFTSKGNLGMGDAIMLLVFGAWENAETVIPAMLFALAGLGTYSAVMFMSGRRRIEIPAVPFLAGGFFLTLLMGC